MNVRFRLPIGLAGCATALCLLPPDAAQLTEFAAWFARPVTLPFAWRELGQAERHGDAAEVFARAQQMMELMPSWTDGYGWFAYRYALAPIEATEPATRGALAQARLDAAMAWLEQARPRVGRREYELLQILAYLPEVACRVEPALADRLRPTGGAPALAAGYIAQLEQRFPGPAVQRQRTFYAPHLTAALLEAGRREQAIAELGAALARGRQLADVELTHDWLVHIDAARRHLAGEPDVDLRAARADRRLEPLLPWLR